MAEAYARTYGSDVMEPSSAGLSPALNSAPLTRAVLKEKNIDLGAHLPRRFRDLNLEDYDLLVNISGARLPEGLPIAVENWDVEDPMGGKEEDFRRASEKLEMLVMSLILRIRTGKI